MRQRVTFSCRFGVGGEARQCPRQHKKVADATLVPELTISTTQLFTTTDAQGSPITFTLTEVTTVYSPTSSASASSIITTTITNVVPVPIPSTSASQNGTATATSSPTTSDASVGTDNSTTTSSTITTTTTTTTSSALETETTSSTSSTTTLSSNLAASPSAIMSGQLINRNLQLQRGGRTGPIVTCPSPNRTDPSDPNPANPNPAAPSPLGAINKAPKRSGHSFLTHLTTATTTTTTTTSAANPATTITATGSSDIPFNSSFKRLSSTSKRPTRPAKIESSRPIGP
ncbi:hypothetical protein P8C59_007424 [Phyllachora maydis]|uniref:Uncharacterized protein n=1 Tax=Phyllachora maydis TaxID=1825666 RepID=A0AAD9I8I3_9PEZI|nr:hypothetical protein P8C59_007424 [Phyllachora maydis]